MRLSAQVHRIDTGEPAHGACQVQVVEHVLAAMSFKAYQHVGAPGPTGHHPRQRCKQQVVDLGTVGHGRFMQKLAGPLRVQMGARIGGVTYLIATLLMITRQIIVSMLQLCVPVGQLLGQIGTLGISLQPFGPRLVGAGLGRQFGRLAGRGCHVGLLQVLQQHAP
ncbi:hypothetical protein D3C79_779410 [compost metagenome]